MGNQGNWFARIEHASKFPELVGRELPCIWDYWYDGKGKYVDAQYAPTKKKTQAVVTALKNHGLAIMRRRRSSSDPDLWESAGYIGVFEVTNVECGEALTFDVVRRACDLD